MSQSLSDQFRSVRTPAVILSDCTRMFTAAGWTVTLRTEDVMTFSHENPVGCYTLALLLLLGLIPGLLYLIARTRTLFITVTSRPIPEGALTQVSWSNAGAAEFCAVLTTHFHATEPDGPFKQAASAVQEPKPGRVIDLIVWIGLVLNLALAVLSLFAFFMDGFPPTLFHLTLLGPLILFSFLAFLCWRGLQQRSNS